MLSAITVGVEDIMRGTVLAVRDKDQDHPAEAETETENVTTEAAVDPILEAVEETEIDEEIEGETRGVMIGVEIEMIREATIVIEEINGIDLMIDEESEETLETVPTAADPHQDTRETKGVAREESTTLPIAIDLTAAIDLIAPEATKTMPAAAVVAAVESTQTNESMQINKITLRMMSLVLLGMEITITKKEATKMATLLQTTTSK